jgi:hypothetical protein
MTMTDRKDALTELLAKVKAGDAPSQTEWRNVFDSLIEGRPSEHYHPILRDYARLAFMGSLDAAKALHEAVLPDFSWSVSKYDRAYISRHTDVNDITTWVEVSARSDNPARAWLIAILKALIAGEDTNDNDNDKGE